MSEDEYSYDEHSSFVNNNARDDPYHDGREIIDDEEHLVGESKNDAVENTEGEEEEGEASEGEEQEEDDDEENVQILSERKAHEKLLSLSLNHNAKLTKGKSEAERVLTSQVLLLCSSLGGIDPVTSKYQLGVDALECLRDLKTWIKRVDIETNTWHVASACDDSNVVLNDLIPILTQLKPNQQASGSYNTMVLLTVLELLVSLTSPLILDTERATEDQLNLYIKLKKAQILYKNKILNFQNGSSLKAIVTLALPIMALNKDQRTTRDIIILNLCLHFFRNIIRIEPPELTISKKVSGSKLQQRTSNMPIGVNMDDISYNSVVVSFKKNKVLRFIQTITAGLESEFSGLVLSNVCFECYFYLTYGLDQQEVLKEYSQTAETTKLANGRSHINDNSVVSELSEIYNKDKSLHTEIMKKKQNSRHANFGTLTSIRQHDGSLLTLSGQSQLLDVDIIEQLDAKKIQTKNAKYSLRKDESTRSDFDTKLNSSKTKNLSPLGRQIMKSFCTDFVEAGFNTLVGIIRRQISEKMSAFVEFHYFSILSWFLKFERIQREEDSKSLDYKLRFGYIQEAMSQENLHLLLKNKMKHYVEQREFNLLRASTETFKEILIAAIAMHQLVIPESSDEETADEIDHYISASEGVLRNIFSSELDLEPFFKVPQDANKISFSYMDEMVEYVNVFFKALKYLSELKESLAIGKKKQARTTKYDKDIEFGDASEDEDMIDAVHNAKSYFVFNKERYQIFERRLLSERILNTHIGFFAKFNELSEVQIRRCLHYFTKILLNREHFFKLARLDFMLILHDLKNAKVNQSLMKEFGKLLSYFMTKLERLFRKTDLMSIELISMHQDPNYRVREYLMTGDPDVADINNPDNSKNARPIIDYKFVEGGPLENGRYTQLDYTQQEELIAIAVSALVYNDETRLLNDLSKQLEYVVTERIIKGKPEESLDNSDNHQLVCESSRIFYRNGLFLLLLKTIGIEADSLSPRVYWIPYSLTSEFLVKVAKIIDIRLNHPLDNDVVEKAIYVDTSALESNVNAEYETGVNNEMVDFIEPASGDMFDDYANENEFIADDQDNNSDKENNPQILEQLDQLDHLESRMLTSNIPKGIAVKKGAKDKKKKREKKKRSRRNKVLDSDDDDLNEVLPKKKVKKSNTEKRRSRHKSNLPLHDIDSSNTSNKQDAPVVEKVKLSAKYVVDSDDSDDDFYERERNLQEAMFKNGGKTLTADQYAEIYKPAKKTMNMSSISSAAFLDIDEPLTNFKPLNSAKAALSEDEDDSVTDDEVALSDDSRADTDSENESEVNEFATQTQFEVNGNVEPGVLGESKSDNEERAGDEDEHFPSRTKAKSRIIDSDEE